MLIFLKLLRREKIIERKLGQNAHFEKEDLFKVISGTFWDGLQYDAKYISRVKMKWFLEVDNTMQMTAVWKEMFVAA